MRVAVHQPNFLPWMGYFSKWASVDRFIFLDNVPFTKGGYQNRVQIGTPQGSQWLTVPVLTKGRLNQPTNEVEINHGLDWRRKHLKTLEQAYGSAAHYQWAMSGLQEAYSREWTHLAPLCLDLLEHYGDLLGIEVPTFLASDFDLPPAVASERLAQLVRAVEGTVYVSGSGGRKYLEPELFERYEIRLEFHEYHFPHYNQSTHAFTPGLSLLDALSFCGPEARNLLRKSG